MSIKPPLNCPPDYSILVFRISECKKASVVKGITNLASLDLNSLYIPIQQHTEGTILLKGGTNRVLNIDGIAEYGPLKEKFEFAIDLSLYPTSLDNGTLHSYELYDEDGNFWSTTFTVNNTDPEYVDFPTALQTACANNTGIQSLTNISTSNVLTTGKFTIDAKKAGIKYRHRFTFDINAANFEHPGNLVTPYTKYPKGRIKYILVFPDYEKVDVSTCGCADSSGDMKSNQKFFQYVNQGEYDTLNNPITPIILNEGVLSETNITWDFNSTDHIGYNVKSGDLVSTVETPLFRTFISNINGYAIDIDQEITFDLTVAGQTLQHVHSPAAPNWINVGDFLFLSGATDIIDSDRCFIETIVLKNPHSFDIPLRYMIGR